jgi:hypothetical protein
VHSSFLHKYDFLYLFEFPKHNWFGSNENWLELQEDIHDEISVVLVFPGIEATIRTKFVTMVFYFLNELGSWDHEGFSKVHHELFE